MKNMKKLKNYTTFNKEFLANSCKLFSFISKEELVKYELISKNKDIGLITLNHPAHRNALNYSILTSLLSILENIEKNHSKEQYPRVVILSSTGPVFSAGHDMKEIYSLKEEMRKDSFQKAADIMIRLKQLNSIVIAEVQGLATAGGCQLAASCDLIVASSKAQFATSGIKSGLFCSTPGIAVSRCVSQKRAMYMLATGLPIDARTALDWGLVNEVIKVDEIKSQEEQLKKLREGSLKLAEHINQFYGKSLQLGKKIFYKQIEEESVESAYKVAVNAMCENFSYKETLTGVEAFMAKKKPVFNVKH
jgi:enoyl-CoA hydratase/carnithine racemase